MGPLFVPSGRMTLEPDLATRRRRADGTEMARFRLLERLFSVLLGVATLFAPLALYAQDNGAVFLPMVAGGQGQTVFAPGQIDLFRTQVAVQTSAQWRDLIGTGALILDRGEDWGLVLVDDEQLADLARWRFVPEETNLLHTLVIAAGASDVGSAAAARFVSLLEQIDAANAVVAADSGAKNSLRSQIRSTVALLTAEERVWLSQVASLDSDGDGLTNDQEVMWCTDAARPDSDFDGVIDGTEVQTLKRWVNHHGSFAHFLR